MEDHMFYVNSRKHFVVELKFDCHFHSKPNCILLNSLILLRKCFCL